MARIPEAELDRVKNATDLVALIRSRGVDLKAQGGRNFVGKCPFHKEDTGSFIVTPDKRLWHCMGCGAAGNCFQFLQKFDGVSFRHTFEILNAGAPAYSAPAETPLKQSTVPRLACPLDPDADDNTLMHQVIDYYHERLWQSPAALEYLEKRGLCHEPTLKKFKIGFADRTLGLRIPAMNRKEGAAIRTRLQTLGIFRENGRENFNGRIVVPIFNADGSIGEIYGRMHTKPNPGISPHHYLPDAHEGIWNAEALNSDTVILCEAMFDALTFYVNGITNVTALYGTEGFTKELWEAILTNNVRKILIGYDADDAGERASKRDTPKLQAHGIECYRIKFPWGMDANEYACKVTPAGKSLQVLVNSAEWLGEKVERSPGPSSAKTPTTSAAAPPAAPPPAPPTQPPVEASHAPAPPVSSNSLAAKLVAKEEIPSTPQPPVAGPIALLHVGENYFMTLGQREYRVGGLDKNNSLEVLKVAVRLRVGEDFHLDNFDMAKDGERRRFIERASEETRLEKDLIKRDIAKLLLAMEQEQTERLAAAMTRDNQQQKPTMTAEEEQEALTQLKSPRLIEWIMEAFPICGLAGENITSLVCYLACTSRLLDKPLAVIIQSTSAAGKSTLMDAVLAMFPEEDRIKYSAMTGQSLYYLGEKNLKHKILAIVEEEGAEKASYALKLLQSEGELTIASTGKDVTSGRMETQVYHVEGPTTIIIATTSMDVEEELGNRALIGTVDESKAQTERIHAVQRLSRTIDGLRLKKKKQTLLKLLKNMQRLLRPLAVVNPYAVELTFTTARTRTRRDHEKYLTIIDVIALLHQFQRPIEHDAESGDFIRVIPSDIALANKIAPELLGRSLDELPPQTRQLLETIKELVRQICQEQQIDQAVALFSRRELQKACGWSYNQIRRHLSRLEELEYIAPKFSVVGAITKYELLIDANEKTELAEIGLIDVEKLTKH